MTIQKTKLASLKAETTALISSPAFSQQLAARFKTMKERIHGSGGTNSTPELMRAFKSKPGSWAAASRGLMPSAA